MNDSGIENEQEPVVKQPQKVPNSSGFIDEEQSAKKTSRSGDGKKTATKVGKKIKKNLQPKKHQNQPN